MKHFYSNSNVTNDKKIYLANHTHESLLSKNIGPKWLLNINIKKVVAPKMPRDKKFICL
jgi:hypothetical protein